MYIKNLNGKLRSSLEQSMANYLESDLYGRLLPRKYTLFQFLHAEYGYRVKMYLHNHRLSNS
jgi:hypothetical protein